MVCQGHIFCTFVAFCNKRSSKVFTSPYFIDFFCDVLYIKWVKKKRRSPQHLRHLKHICTHYWHSQDHCLKRGDVGWTKERGKYKRSCSFVQAHELFLVDVT